MAAVRTAYVYDADLRIKANAQGRNYWYEYVREICDQLGLRAAAIPRQALADGATLSQYSVLIVGDFAASELPPGAAANLDAWVTQGGALIGFATDGLDEVFGNKAGGVTRQPIDDFTLAGFFDLKPDPLTTDVHSPLHPDQKLLVFSDMRNVTPVNSRRLGDMFYKTGRGAGFAAITAREHGQGHAFYFAFNVPKTVWVLHQGRPIDKDYDGDGYYRFSDAMVIGQNSDEVAYADEILFLLQNMLGRRRVPLIHQLPPLGDQIPDALFHWGGDDEAAAGTQLWASNWMKERGLPYHLNIMPKDGRFHLTADEARAIEANGHELAVHYNFIDGYQHPAHFTEREIRAQADLFAATFGKRSVCSVFHWCRWTGWAEPAKWIAAAGGKGDNSRIHSGSPPLNPANQLGFGGSGTSFPFFYYDDWRAGNARIEFLCEPITAYETGYRPGKTFPELTHTVVDLAAKYHLTMDMFYHPVNVTRVAECRLAIDEVLRYIRERGIVARHMGNDELCCWWFARSESSISNVATDGASIAFTADARHRDGLVIKIPLQAGKAVKAVCDGKPTPFKTAHEFAQNWAFVLVPCGNHRVNVESAAT